MFLDEDEPDDPLLHIKQAKSNALDNAHNLGLATAFQAEILRRQGRLKEARSEASRAVEIFEKIGASGDARACKDLLKEIEGGMEDRHID